MLWVWRFGAEKRGQISYFGVVVFGGDHLRIVVYAASEVGVQVVKRIM